MTLLTVREAAAQLGRSRGFVLALAADGLVGARKRGGRWYIDGEDLDAWVRSGRVNPEVGRVVTPPRVWRKPDAA